MSEVRMPETVLWFVTSCRSCCDWLLVSIADVTGYWLLKLPWLVSGCASCNDWLRIVRVIVNGLWFLVQCAGSKLWLFRIKYLSPYWSEITNTRIKNLALSVLVYSFIDEFGIVAFYVTELAILFFLLTSAQRLSNL